jgi:hypothetical protein
MAERTQPDQQDLERRMAELEKDPPKRPEDWPDDRDMRNATFGGPEGDHGYEEGPEAKLGPSGLRHHEDGRVSIDGEFVDDPSQYKGEPIPGGPTDPRSGRPRAEE